MSDPEKKICRYFNTIGGCWYGDSCKFLHIPNKKPPCKFYGSSTGCRYGDSCHFSHDRTPFKSVENYNNAPAEHMKEAFKENMDPSELSGTNNNNMTQSMAGLVPSGQQAQQSQSLPLLPTTSQQSGQTQPMTTSSSDLLLSDAHRYASDLGPSLALLGKDDHSRCDANHTLTDPATTGAAPLNNNATAASALATVTATSTTPTAEAADTETASVGASTTPCFQPDGELAFGSTGMTSANLDVNPNSTAANDSMLLVMGTGSASISPESPMPISLTRTNQLSADMDVRPVEGISTSGGRMDEGSNYALAPINGRPNGMASDMEIYCGSCKRTLERRGNESYCTLLKNHYLECFLDKEGDHVKYVKTKAALEPGQMYWCKSCILIFEKPWSLFQHMADKAKGSKVQRWEKKIHLDWMDSVAGLMAGYDLGLFSPAKLRIDLRNLLADHHTMEEEMEAAAVTAAAMMQWLAPLSSPWRLQQREMMRKIEQLNRQMLRKASHGLNAATGGYPMRAALTAAPMTPSANNPNVTHSINYVPNHRTTHANSMPSIQPPARLIDGTSNEKANEEPPTETSSGQCQTTESSETTTQGTTSLTSMTNLDPETVGPLGDQETVGIGSSDGPSGSNDCGSVTGAAGDSLLDDSEMKSAKVVTETNDIPNEGSDGSVDSVTAVVDTNNTNSTHSASARGDEVGRRVGDVKRVNPNLLGYNYAGPKAFNSTGSIGKGPCESMRYQLRTRGSRAPGYGHPSGTFGTAHRGMHRGSRLSTGNSGPPSRAANSFNPPSFHASLDLNCGFTDDEVEELLSQGIKPWDSEAAAALAVLRGEMDHLLD
ncbi:Zinc finger CCCH domain-containing protein 31 [Fasciola gigantica]|uniref:Zinc finger CCCH domain-containing protein 31 n=1 Tax=Fasciola gigantica TaxID=46835 RepID=A0A504WT47_FASGI|nr:Zinc finger CCCH domain-containing protein 31 [Fasciola gigantica]